MPSPRHGRAGQGQGAGHGGGSCPLPPTWSHPCSKADASGVAYATWMASLARSHASVLYPRVSGCNSQTFKHLSLLYRRGPRNRCGAGSAYMSPTFRARRVRPYRVYCMQRNIDWLNQTINNSCIVLIRLRLAPEMSQEGYEVSIRLDLKANMFWKRFTCRKGKGKGKGKRRFV